MSMRGFWFDGPSTADHRSANPLDGLKDRFLSYKCPEPRKTIFFPAGLMVFFDHKKKTVA